MSGVNDTADGAPLGSYGPRTRAALEAVTS
jgi:hypothetical protein